MFAAKNSNLATGARWLPTIVTTLEEISVLWPTAIHGGHVSIMQWKLKSIVSRDVYRLSFVSFDQQTSITMAKEEDGSLNRSSSPPKESAANEVRKCVHNSAVCTFARSHL